MLKFKTRKLFLMDACGALISAILLGLVLARFESLFGMPSHILYLLSVIAGFFAIFSFLSYLLVSEKQKTFLQIIAIANLLYAVLSIILVFYFYNCLTGFGLFYFIAEILVIAFLAILEWKTASGLTFEKKS